jgi:5-methylcytosine-specific restriction enzyme subunit McrC
MEIPVQNLYHLLTYAWDQLDEADQVAVTAEPADTLLDLLARVLVQGTTHALKRGLARDYLPEQELTGRLRGKLLLAESVRQQTLPTARAWCAFDELSHDNLPNQLLKSALYHLQGNHSLSGSLRQQVRALYVRLGDVTLLPVPDARVYEQVQLHRHTAHYRLLLSICRLVHEEVLLSQQTGEHLFRDFTGNDKRMAALFERFVRNFYRLRQEHYSVQAEQLQWDLTAMTSQAREVLPAMKTDISLTGKTDKIIIDCKYYREALKTHYDKEKLISNNLYQLYAYVQHARYQQPIRPVRGLLLYPVVQKALRFQYKLTGTTDWLEVATIDLSQHWQDIEQHLLDLLRWPDKTQVISG